MSYAVIDFETTGFVPENTDRVLEVGVVLTDDLGRIEHEWGTLVNAGRDVGAAHVHGISAADLHDAPTFAEIADHLVTLLAGRTIVAHNASFDMRFLGAELRRASFDVAPQPPALCSMRWAGRTIGSAKLQHCCEALGVELSDAHHALADARATAGLLEHLVRMVGTDPGWLADSGASAAFQWPSVSPGSAAPRTAVRGHAMDDPHRWLRTVLQAAWVPGNPENEASYLDVLDRALLDRHISTSEGRELRAVAEAAGLSRQTVGRLHHDHLRAVAIEALADGVVTFEERDDLERIATSLGLGLPYVDEALAWAKENAASETRNSFTLNAGDRIVFTGEMERARDEWVREIVSAGLASGGVTKSTRALVCADTDSLSGKAKKARDYGIPVIDERTFNRHFEAYLKARS